VERRKAEMYWGRGRKSEGAWVDIGGDMNWSISLVVPRPLLEWKRGEVGTNGHDICVTIGRGGLFIQNEGLSYL
jgi:hypothetical protein